jgi:hypothetical protein
MEPARPLSKLARLARLALLLVAAGLIAALSGCSPKIGDHCVLNTDCGTSGTLVCDTSLPNGYCTQFNCTPDVCQNKAACVALEPALPGCPYDDYHSPSRTSRTLCLAQCQSDSDCRQNDGYVCEDPRQPPWSAAIIDDVQSQRVCVPAFSSKLVPRPILDAGLRSLPEGSVCSPSGPQLDASGADAATDALTDDSGDATPFASDGGNDAEAAADALAEAAGDGGDGGDGSGDAAPDGAMAPDGAGDASSDAGAPDAPDGG